MEWNVKRLIVFVAIGIAVASYLFFSYSTKVGVIYIVLGAYTIVGYIALAKGKKKLVIPLLLGFILLWYMTNVDFLLYGFLSIFILFIFVIYILTGK